MNRYKKQKQSFYLVLIILLILGVGIGYALLTETLTISNSAMLAEMKWDVGFSNVEDNGSTIPVDTEISNNGKTMTVLCDFGLNTDQQTCTVKATIKNDSTFDIGLKNDPVISYDDTYIHTVTFKWDDHPTYENHTVYKDNFIKKGESEEVILTIKTKFIKKEMLPILNTTIPITITLNFIEWKNGDFPEKEDLAVLKSTSETDESYFRTAEYKEHIKTITFEDEINISNDALKVWDISEAQNGNVMAYVVTNETNSMYYDFYIQSDTQLYANENMDSWFFEFINLEEIKGLELLDTSMTTSMVSMFAVAGQLSESLMLDFSNFDTSSVIDMSYMFSNAFSNCDNLILDLSHFDTSNVTNMSWMFTSMGDYSSSLKLDLSNFDVRGVTDMSYMFMHTGYSCSEFALDLRSFNTSKVTNMCYMFYDTGYSSTNFMLDISNFDTSNVIDMSSMFYRIGFYNPNFTLDVSNFDTSNVTDMSGMFYDTGCNNPNFQLDVSHFDTSKVISFSSMFYGVGRDSTIFNTSITIRNPNIEYYSYMFMNVATKGNSKITVNYTSETEAIVDRLIATKSENSNVVKGKLVS